MLQALSSPTCATRRQQNVHFFRVVGRFSEKTLVLNSCRQRKRRFFDVAMKHLLRWRFFGVAMAQAVVSSIFQRLVKHAAKFRRTHKKVFKKKKRFKDSEKVCLKKRKICMWPLCPCRFFCIFVGIAKGMNDFICRLCVRSVQTFKYN